jgi:hypothetical protein
MCLPETPYMLWRLRLRARSGRLGTWRLSSFRYSTRFDSSLDHARRCTSKSWALRRLDHVIVVSEVGLRRVLASYVAYYMRSRTHLALAKDSPLPRAVYAPSSGRIVATPEVGGLHHRYERVAA